MTRLFIVTAIVVLAGLGPGQEARAGKAPSPDGERAVALRQASAEPVRARRDPAGRIVSLAGRFQAEAAEPEEGARIFLARWSDLFGLKPGLTNLTLERQVDDIGGTVLRFEQEHLGLPVFGAGVLVGLAPDGSLIHVRADYAQDLPARVAVEISEDAALLRAEASLGSRFDDLWDVRAVIVRGDKGWPGHHVAWEVHGFAREPLGDWHVFVDVMTGDIVRTLNFLRRTGPSCVPCNPATDADCGNLFFENAVDAADDPSLRDFNNVDAYQTGCKLNNLTSATNLTGLYADTTITGARVGPPYDYLRSAGSVAPGITGQKAVDEVTVYYHVNRAKEYLNTLGFPGVMNFSLDLDAHDAGIGDNSYYSPGTVELHFGEGGVDDGQVPDLVYHEYGHAIQDNQVPGWGATYEGGAMGEAFGDYWAAALTDLSWAALLGPECVGSWDATSYNPWDGGFGSGCLRRIDHPWFYPRDLRYQGVHADGEIWSAGLWDLRQAVGGAIADALVIKGHTFLTSSAQFIDGADALITADAALYGGTYATSIHGTMAGRGIPRTGTPASSTGLDQSVAYVCETTHNYVDLSYKECSFTQPGAERIRAHFSRLDTEFDYDWVLVSDGDYNQVEALSGCPFGGCTTPGYSAAVDGDTIVVRMKADPLVTAWGFRVDSIEYAEPTCNPVDCNDGNPCTVDYCDGAVCANDPGNPGALCRTTAFTCDVAEFCTGVSATCPADDYLPNGTACDNGCNGDTCQSGACTPSGVETRDLQILVDTVTLDWTSTGPGAIYDVAQGVVAELPVGAGGSEACERSGWSQTTLTDPDVPNIGDVLWYLVRSSCGSVNYGAETGGSPRVTTICP